MKESQSLCSTNHNFYSGQPWQTTRISCFDTSHEKSETENGDKSFCSFYNRSYKKINAYSKIVDPRGFPLPYTRKREVSAPPPNNIQSTSLDDDASIAPKKPLQSENSTILKLLLLIRNSSYNQKKSIFRPKQIAHQPFLMALISIQIKQFNSNRLSIQTRLNLVINKPLVNGSKSTFTEKIS